MGATKRRFEQFLTNPSSIRYAVAAIISVTVLAVVLGAIVVRLFDRSEYPTFGRALWFTLQTVTTVGYGDVTPADPVGRIVASIVMLTSIGLIAVITAAVTSTFVAAAARRDARTTQFALDEARLAADRTDLTRDEARRGFDDLALRLDRIERALGLPSDAATTEPRDD